ncbi:glutamate receptor ionotropic, delta-2-like [Palaemon carinicauda]|uniref:glutamate receptor ionotropic, delta-2-like n=1 Tax=Palaemon carinicauda TaxID=392227 RepID=UPI0035B6A98E
MKILLLAPSTLKCAVSTYLPGNGILFAQSNCRPFPSTFNISVVALLIVGLGSSPVGCTGLQSSPSSSTAGIQTPLGAEWSLRWRVGEALRDLVKQRAEGCHLFLVSSTAASSLLQPLIRFWQEEEKATVEINLSAELNAFLDAETSNLLHEIVAETACWAMILDLSTRGNLVLSFIEKSRLFYFPKIPVIAVGSEEDVEEFLLKEVALRNSIQTFYLSYSHRVAAAFLQGRSLEDPAKGQLLRESLFIESRMTSQERLEELGLNEDLKIFVRCLYCKKGYEGFQFVYRWPLYQKLDHRILPLDEVKNLNGHVINVVCLLRIPYINYDVIEGSADKRVQYRDSYEFRITETAAQIYNFTFDVREPWDGQWGLPDESGNFSGIVGTLQYEKADFSFLLTPLPVRLLGMDIGGVFIDDPFLILSHKPEPLPRSLAIVAPFGDTVWMGVVLSGVLYGVSLWLANRGWGSYLKEKTMDLSYSMFYILRILLEDPPTFVPRQISLQFLISWWALVSFVLLSAYKSALISNLTVVKRYEAINSMEDLWRRKDMSWGSIYMSPSGASYLYLATNPNPVIRKLAAEIQTLEPDAHLERVLAGDYAYITRNSWALTDLLRIEMENLPIHIGISKYPVSCGYTWGFRKGSPLRAPMDRLQRRLVETGLTEIWLREIVTEIAVRVRQTGKALQSTARSSQVGRNRELTLEHLQGAFFLLFIGGGVAFIVLILEILRYRSS